MLEADDDQFGDGGIAFFCDAVDGDEHICFGIVGRGALAGYGVGDDDEAMGDTVNAAVVIKNIYDIVCVEVLFLYIVFVEEDDASFIEDAAIAIV